MVQLFSSIEFCSILRRKNTFLRREQAKIGKRKAKSQNSDSSDDEEMLRFVLTLYPLS